VPGLHSVDEKPVSLSDEDEDAGGTAPSEETAEVVRMDDAVLLGENHPEMQELLMRPAVFMTGDLYGQRDRRNTQDGNWKGAEMPWLAWINGAAKGDEIGGKKIAQTWGLSRHPVSKGKEGASIVLSDALDGARTDSAIKTMYAVGLDIDSGAALDDVLDKLEEKNLFALVYTS